MRMTDTLGAGGRNFPEYNEAYAILAGVLGESSDWKVVTDSHQISTRQAGKSSCAFLVKNFDSLQEAIAALNLIHKKLPSVNCELQLTPDGILDRGDGPGYFHQATWQKESQYLPLEGFGCTLLVDAQNLIRAKQILIDSLED